MLYPVAGMSYFFLSSPKPNEGTMGPREHMTLRYIKKVTMEGQLFSTFFSPLKFNVEKKLSRNKNSLF